MATRDKTSAELCELLDIEPPELARLVKAGLPHDGNGAGARFEESEVQAFIAKHPPKKSAKAPPDLAAAKLAKEKELLRRYARFNAVEKGELLDAGECERRCITNIVALKNRLLGLASMIVPQISGLGKADRLAIIAGVMQDIRQTWVDGCDAIGR